MAQTKANYHMDEKPKKEMEYTCQEKEASVALTSEPFLCAANLRYLSGKIDAYKKGELQLVEYNLSES